MLCDKCNKNEANVFIERTINGNKEKFALCSGCAGNMDGDLPFTLDLGGLLAGFTQFTQHPVENTLTCTECGSSFESFEKRGRLGCSGCYDSFREQLTPIVKRIHGSSQHTGTQVYQMDKDQLELQALKANLSEAILDENFELAAQLRDKIKAMEEVGSHDSVD